MPPPASALTDRLVAADALGVPVLTRTCHTQAMVESLDPAAAAALTAALANPDVATAALLRVLDAHGFPARAENINRHRRRLQGGNYTCKCPLPVPAQKATA